jgi:hypothetical protein
VALGWLWGAYQLAINTLWGGFDIALMSHWGGFGCPLDTRPLYYWVLEVNGCL